MPAHHFDELRVAPGRPDGSEMACRPEQESDEPKPQAEAERAAREIAINQKSEVLIHGEDGRIRERNSYGNDPYPPKG